MSNFALLSTRKGKARREVKKNLSFIFKFNKRASAQKKVKVMKALKRKTSIYHNGKRLDLEIEEYKNLFRAYIIDAPNCWFCCMNILRVHKHKDINYTKAVEIFREMCINNKWF